MFKKSGFIKKYNDTIKSVYLKQYGRLGNNIVQLINAVFFSEILNITTIYVPEGFCMISKSIINNETRTNIVPSNQIPNGTVILGPELFDLNFYQSNPYKWARVFASETLKNLPHVNVRDDDLCIHIRSGDIFSRRPCPIYGQPPLCFYEAIINKWGFKSIFILSEDRWSPVTKPLVEKYNAKLIITDRPTTISYILSARNLVLSFGTFIPSLLKLVPDDPGRRIFRYGGSHDYTFDIWKEYYFMTPSKYYSQNMLGRNWRNTEEQRKIMLNETCNDNWHLSKQTKCRTR